MIPAAFRKELGIGEEATMLRMTLLDGELRITAVEVSEPMLASPWLRELDEYFVPVREEILARHLRRGSPRGHRRRDRGGASRATYQATVRIGLETVILVRVLPSPPTSPPGTYPARRSLQRGWCAGGDLPSLLINVP